ncbi:MAG: methyltransferase [Rhodoferax sp.]|nr:methyltransferase [Rhodoferax sp.]
MNEEAFREMLAHEKDHWWYRGRREILHHVIKRRVGAVGRLLEIGCGTGSNLQMLSDFGQVVGIETSEFARDFAASRGFPVHDGRLPNGLPRDIGSFDAVCMFDVLEHIEGDAEALKAVRRLLNPGGRLVVSVPAYQWLWSAHDVHLHHFRRYSKPRLTELLQEAGFTVTWASYFNSVLFPPAAAVRFMSRWLARSAEPGVEPPAKTDLPIGNQFLYGLFKSECRMLDAGGLPFGLSIMAIATPNPA